MTCSGLVRRLVVACGAVVIAGTARAGEIDHALRAIIDETGPDEVISTLVFLADRADVPSLVADLDAEGASRGVRHEVVVRRLRDAAAHGQADLLARCDELAALGRVSRVQPAWLASVVRVDASPAQILALAARPDVERVYYNAPIAGERPSAAEGAPAADGAGIEPGVQVVRAPDAWALGYTGAGVLVATLDTGVDGTHPALATRWRGNEPAYAGHPEWAFFDPISGWTSPQDSGAHGTHVMGTICGGAPGDAIGVAPGAEWISAAVIDRAGIEATVADAILALQWIVDPDGDPGTSFDVPHVCANAWGLADFHGYPDCDETFWSFLDAAEAAGVVVLFGAGGDGTDGLRRPADRATDDYRTLAVGAVDGGAPGWPVAPFSSRGPTLCTPDGSPAIKPELAGPGVQVRSSVPGGTYSFYDGTSSAVAHVAGLVALVREANPDLGVEQVKQILYDTAVDVGPPGDDNGAGHGVVDALAAVNLALEMLPPPADLDGDGDVDFGDLLMLLGAWGPCAQCAADLDDDGAVAFSDLLLLLGAWTG